MTTDKIIKAINDFVPFAENDLDNDNETYLYDLSEKLKDNTDSQRVIEPILRLIERFPNADLGSPGPLVHTLESFIGGYEPFLFDSLDRRPTPLTIWMLNRIINAEKDSLNKRALIDKMKALQMHPNINKETQDDIQVSFPKQLTK